MAEAAAIHSIHEVNEQIIILNAQNQYDGFKNRNFNPCFTDCEYKNAPAKVYGLFERLHRARHGGIIDIKQKTIAAQLKCHIKTVRRAIRQIENDGRLIVLRNWQNRYIFLPPGNKIKGIKSQIEAIIAAASGEKSMGHFVPKNRTKCPIDTYICNESCLKSSPDRQPDENPPPPPPDPPQKKQPSAKLFYNNQIKFLGTLIESIKISCEKIEAMAKRKNNDFNAYRLVGSAIKKKYHVRAISNVLQSTIYYNYDFIFEDGFNSWGWLMSAFKVENGKCNAYDSRKFSETLKRDEQAFCDKMKQEGIEF